MTTELIQKISNSSPELRFCDLFNGLSPLWNYDLHKHAYLELIYRKSGQGQTDLLETTQNFTLFDTMVYPVDCWHQDKFEATEANVAYCLWIHIPEVSLDKPMQIQDRNGKLGYLFHAIYEEYQKPDPCKPLISLLLRTLLIQILLLGEERPASNIDRVIQYIDTHLSEKITLDQLSSLIFVSKSYLTKQFKQETGQTIIEYINSARVEAAKMLLVTTNKSVEEIAYEVGFESPKYFFRIFKAATGMTPMSFCKKR